MNAAYLILGLPLLGGVVLFVAGRRIGNPWAGVLATALAGGGFVATLVTWLTLLGRSAAHRSVDKQIFTWLPVGQLHVDFALRLDPLSVMMALFVTGVGSLITLYSIGYMAHDPEFPKFFFLLNLFLASMVTLVLADNFLFSFLGWEGVGFCSYGLIGFWFERNSAAVAAKKAFVTNRVGDFGFMIALFLMWQHFHSFDYSVVLTPLMSGHAHISSGTATGLGLMLFLGAAGKSAQLPLYMWLPDAMEGPTPVSALIHAATMVTAGVYLMARAAPILHYTHVTQWIIACIGASTAFFAATVACNQDDIKRVLAYSTLSQLGYMFLAIGAGGYSDGLFHMVTHAFFKALLFLGAGSVIHAMRDEQDMKRMGALRRFLPITFWTFLLAALALSGIFPLAGFWSKDDILDAAWRMNFFLWLTGAATAVLTAYYMGRLLSLTWFGQARWGKETGGTAEAEVAGAHGHDAHGHDSGEPHESPPVMTIPLVILGVATVLGGALNLPFFHWDFIDKWLAPVFPASIAPVIHVASGTKLALSLVVLAACLFGLAFGWRSWLTPVHPKLEPAFLYHQWYFDDTVAALVSGPLEAGANELAYGLDAQVLDGSANGLARLTAGTGRQLRRLQTGYVRNYALGIAFGVAVVLCYVAARVGS